jgi:hypothetical protein
MGSTSSREQVDEVKAETPFIPDIETNEEENPEDLDNENPLNMTWFWPFM